MGKSIIINKELINSLSELDKLELYLMIRNMKYVRYECHEEIDEEGFKLVLDRHQIIVGVDKEEASSASHKVSGEWDAVCQKGSYGYEEGLLEIYGSIVRPDAEDSVEGWLTAIDVIERVEAQGHVIKIH